MKYCAPLSDCISEIKNEKIDHAINTEVVIPMYNLIKYTGNYLKTSESLSKCHKDEPFTNNNGVIIDVPDDPYNA